jgi:hypothetical protein
MVALADSHVAPTSVAGLGEADRRLARRVKCSASHSPRLQSIRPAVICEPPALYGDYRKGGDGVTIWHSVGARPALAVSAASEGDAAGLLDAARAQIRSRLSKGCPKAQIADGAEGDYLPKLLISLVPVEGLEPPTHGLQNRCSTN